MCTIAATDLNLCCFNTVVWATNGLSICEIIFIFLSNGNKIANVLDF